MRLLLIGWDAADWKIIQPLLDAGQMPNLARLIAGGVHGNLATIYPVLSPMLWTSIATGKRAYKHGIHGFSEPLPDGSGVRPISVLSRKAKAVWNILNQTGHRSLVVGWWPSHPTEPLNGAMVSNHFQEAVGLPGQLPPLAAGTVHPPSLADSIRDLRVHPMELEGEHIRLFVPDYQKVDQKTDRRLHTLGKIIAETMSVHAVATDLLASEPWDFAAIYYSGLDHFGHAFMQYHPPRLPWVSENDFSIYQHVVANAYRYHDAMLGTLLDSVDQKTTVILMSDHGFHPDHSRPGYIPVEAAGPAVEHRHFGMVCMKGPALRVNEQIFGAGVLDICPTILALFGQPAGKDMDGKILVTAFKEPPTMEPIESWESLPGAAGTHSPDAQLDSTASAQAFRQLVELGYVAPPPADAQQAVEESTRELKYNLARAWRDGNCCGEAAALAGELWSRWPKEHRFGILLVDCLELLGQIERRRGVIEELEQRIKLYQKEAQQELVRREAEPKSKEAAHPDPANQTRAQFEERQLRELAYGRPLLIEWFLVTQALLEKLPAEARRYLRKLTESGVSNAVLQERIAGALAELGDIDASLVLLQEVLEQDVENPGVHTQLAALHFKAGRLEDAIASATESLSLLYFQPGLHALLGQALLKTERFDEAEKELCVAIAQSPRNLAAHELLGTLYRQHLNRPADAFAHEGRALSLRHDLAARQAGLGEKQDVPDRKSGRIELTASTLKAGEICSGCPPAFGAKVDPEQIITVVAGLPRSGTSMMMQLLAMAGLQILTDAKRVADEDNPLGYFEFEKTGELARNTSWVPEARGKAVKIVAQLLPFLPATEHYQLIFMERDLREVIASQKAMLTRQGRRGAELDDSQLVEVYAEQLHHVEVQLKKRPEFRILWVSYAGLLAEPQAGVERLAAFLGAPFDKEAAIKSIRPQLRRQKAETA